jgi:glycosyltransferase involved in cell wall biosynthesis
VSETGDELPGAALVRHPPVSIVCAFYNGERFLAEAIDSVLAQSFADFELILVDDGSTDGSARIARACAARDPRLHFIEGGLNRGASAARNLGVDRARGNLIAFIDADDRWRPHKLAEQVALMDALPVVGMICGRVNYWSSWNGGEDHLVQTGDRAGVTMAPPEALLRLYPLGGAAAPCPSDLMIRSTVVRSVGGFARGFEGPVQLYEDQGFLTKVYLATPLHFARSIWVDYRQHRESCVSVSHARGQYAPMRRHFLEWLEAYVATTGRADPSISRAIARARRDLDHPLLARIRRRIVGH